MHNQFSPGSPMRQLHDFLHAPLRSDSGQSTARRRPFSFSSPKASVPRVLTLAVDSPASALHPVLLDRAHATAPTSVEVTMTAAVPDLGSVRAGVGGKERGQDSRRSQVRRLFAKDADGPSSKPESVSAHGEATTAPLARPIAAKSTTAPDGDGPSVRRLRSILPPGSTRSLSISSAISFDRCASPSLSPSSSSSTTVSPPSTDSLPLSLPLPLPLPLSLPPAPNSSLSSALSPPSSSSSSSSLASADSAPSQPSYSSSVSSSSSSSSLSPLPICPGTTSSTVDCSPVRLLASVHHQQTATPLYDLDLSLDHDLGLVVISSSPPSFLDPVLSSDCIRSQSSHLVCTCSNINPNSCVCISTSTSASTNCTAGNSISRSSNSSSSSSSSASKSTCRQPCSPHGPHARHNSCPCLGTPATPLHSHKHHRSSSTALLLTGVQPVSARIPTTVALNTSPVECQSCSDSARRPSRFPSLPFRRLSRGSNLARACSLSALPDHPATPHEYQAPDYLTAFFAHTPRYPSVTSRPRSRHTHSHDPRDSQSAPPAATSSTSASPRTVSARPLRFRSSVLAVSSSPSSAAAPLLQSSPSSLPTPSTPSSANQTTGSTTFTSSIPPRSHPAPDARLAHPPPRPIVTSSLGRHHACHKTTPHSLYQPIMIPRKTKQTLSLVTTEQSHHGGPARSTQTTVHAGDWGERSARSGTTSTSDSQRPPNSATSPNQDPWMLVNGSESATATPSFSTGNGNDAIARLQPNNNNGSSSSIDSVPTPTLTREEQVNKLPPLQLLDRYDDSDPVLDVDIAAQIRLELPRRLRNATKWSLVYSSDQHGISMSTLFHRCKGKGPMIMAIKDTTDAVFGAYITEELKPNLSYYGTGECFLWNVTTLVPSPQPPASPAFLPTTLASPSPFQLSNSSTPTPTPTASTPINASQGSLSPPPSRRMELHQAMSDRMSLHPVPRSPSPFSSSPRQPVPQVGARQTPQQLRDRSVSPMSSPTLRPATSSSSTSGTPLLGPVGSMGSGPGSGTGGTKSNAGSRRKKRQKVVQYWKWTGMNDYMVLSEPGFIGLGGGKGKFGLWIHSDLERGHSSRCETFDNEPLALACHHPIRAGVPAAVSVTEPSPSSGSDSRSSSPKSLADKEEFYCQTIEIWSMIL